MKNLVKNLTLTKFHFIYLLDMILKEVANVEL